VIAQFPDRRGTPYAGTDDLVIINLVSMLSIGIDQTWFNARTPSQPITYQLKMK